MERERGKRYGRYGTLVAIALGALEPGAAEFVGDTMPDPVLEANISALAQVVEPADPKGRKAEVSVSRLIGKETIAGSGRFRVWYCVERNADGKPSTSCGGDIVLSRLDTGHWIIKDENRGAWLLVKQ